MVEYIWPDPVEVDGKALSTKYTTTAKKAYEVVGVESILYRAPLVTPPPLHETRTGETPYLVLNYDIYINW